MNLNEAYSKLPPILRYALAATIFLTALQLRFLALPVDAGFAFITFYPAMVVSFYICGIRPGAVTVILSAVTGYYIFIPPFWTFAPDKDEAIAAISFLITAYLTASIVKQMRRHSEQFHHAMSELQLGEQRYRALLEDQTEVICRFKVDGTILYVNDAYCRLFGKPRESLIGHKWQPVAWHEDIPLIHEKLQQMSPDNPIAVIENRILTKGGAIRWAQFINRGFFDSEGRLIETQSVGRDITERKELEEKLAASTKEIEDLYDHAPCGYHSVGPDGVYLRINATELSWLGYQREEIIGKKHLSDFYTPEGKRQLNEQFPIFLREGEVKNLEYELICKDGGSRYVSLSATAIKDADGNFLRSRGVMYDITERKQIEEKLHKLAQEQNAMLDNDLIAIFKIRDRIIVWKNRATAQIFGYEHGELIGKPTRALYPDDQSYQALGESAYPILKANGTYRAQLELVRKNGEKVWVDISGALLPGDGHDSLWMMLDITEIKKQQEQIQHIAHHDILTDLPNRLLLADRLDQAIAQSGRSGHLLAVCYLDLDGFKQVNDHFGHTAGDMLLKEAAHRMQSSVRSNDTVCRLGGDEFVLLLTDLKDANEHQMVLERVIAEINKPVRLNGHDEAKVTASIGITIFPSDDGNSDSLLRHADWAMYQAKKLGRNRVHLYHQDLP
ncbi:PAS domain S-box protein [Methylovulum miyakonense]|uniref:PAS domain S-box protein n=1 Tax=Methylovulum miyakonense TaxID=645578 RepID=UPI000365DB34|nr:PAS domain S-box protein [Methylovulum miyakonense]